MNLRDQMERIYQDLPVVRIPWNLEAPPELLVDLVRGGKVTPCDAVDVGCGAGNYTVWLASQGFRMTGVDISPSALRLARELACEKGVQCDFVEADLTARPSGLKNTFDFGLDWEVLHHVFPESRPAFVAAVAGMLRPGATHLSVCFSDRDPGFGGVGKHRQTPLGTTLYFSSESEVEETFSPSFEIQDLRTVEVAGKFGPHLAVAVLLTRRGSLTPAAD